MKTFLGGKNKKKTNPKNSRFLFPFNCGGIQDPMCAGWVQRIGLCETNPVNSYHSWTRDGDHIQKADCQQRCKNWEESGSRERKVGFSRAEAAPPPQSSRWLTEQALLLGHPGCRPGPADEAIYDFLPKVWPLSWDGGTAAGDGLLFPHNGMWDSQWAPTEGEAGMAPSCSPHSLDIFSISGARNLTIYRAGCPLINCSNT